MHQREKKYNKKEAVLSIFVLQLLHWTQYSIMLILIATMESFNF